MGTWFVLKNDKGSILNISLLMLVTLSLIVVYLARSTSTDVKIASNEKQERIQFYSADSGADTGAELIEQSLACPSGFTESSPGSGSLTIGTLFVKNLMIYSNPAPSEPTSDATRDAYWPAGSSYADAGSTSLALGRQALRINRGSSLQMAAGYEGVGRSAGSGGISLYFDIWSQHFGSGGSPAVVFLRWKHLVGTEGSCMY